MQAIIDIGSTSVRLSFCNPKAAVNQKQVATTKLAENEQDGYLWDEAQKRTAEAVCGFVKQAEAAGFEPHIFATEAVRSAKNKNEFLQLIKTKCGRDVFVVEKNDEAKLAFFGVYTSGRVGIVDMGGGSTELCVGDDSGILYVKSLPVGVVRLFNMQKAGEDVKSHLFDAVKQYGQPPKFESLIAVGGTACTIVSMLEGLKTYDAKKVQGRRVTSAELAKLYDKIKDMPLSERLALAGLEPKRAEIIHNGLLFYLVILDYFGLDSFVVSDRDNIEGFAVYLENGKKW